jgi:hypothetical protein
VCNNKLNIDGALGALNKKTNTCLSKLACNVNLKVLRIHDVYIDFTSSYKWPTYQILTTSRKILERGLDESVLLVIDPIITC